VQLPFIARSVPWVRRHKISPVTGLPLTTRDLIKLHFQRNPDGPGWACPVTGKVFTEHSRIAAVRTTGNVYAWEAIDTLCLQPKRLRDLITDEPIAKDGTSFR